MTAPLLLPFGLSVPMTVLHRPLFCHSRESGDPGPQQAVLSTLDSRFRGNDNPLFQLATA
jgi:hypothetical protein